MKNESSAWADISSKYLRDVERALAGVKHPRKSEVIEDVRAHLDEAYSNLPPEGRTEEAFRSLIEEMGPPDDYAGLLTDADPPARRRRYLLAAVICLAAATVAAWAYSALWGSPQARAETLFSLGRGFSTPPFFSMKAFKAIKPGMSADDVRNVIGCPFVRGVWSGREAECDWDYSDVPFSGATVFEKLTVTLSRQTGRVIRTDAARVSIPDGGHAPRRLVSGPLTLTRADSSQRTLKPSDMGLFLLTFGEAGTGRMQPRELYDYIDRSAANLLSASGVAGAKVIHVCCGVTTDVYAPEGSETYTGWSLGSIPDSRLAVYANGTTYFVPPIYGGLSEEDFKQDQIWLLRKLAGVSH